jgi:hypothetical protein
MPRAPMSCLRPSPSCPVLPASPSSGKARSRPSSSAWRKASGSPTGCAGRAPCRTIGYPPLIGLPTCSCCPAGEDLRDDTDRGAGEQEALGRNPVRQSGRYRSRWNGLLVPVDDAQALAAAMEQMRNAHRSFDPGALRADALSRFGVASVACRFESWYRGLLDGRQMIVNR